MGTYGTSLKDNDTFADIYGKFFERYDNGDNPVDISSKLIDDNQELIHDSENGHSFWFALALAQWETKTLENRVLSKVEDIVLSGKDLLVWRNLDADEADIRKRRIILDRFLAKLKTEKPNAKPRKKPKNISPVFATGDCFCFKLSNGNYGGAIVLATNTDPALGLNLIASTTINQLNKPTVIDFESADILVCNFSNWNDEPKITWYYPPLPKNNLTSFEVVGRTQIEIHYDSSVYDNKSHPFHPTFSAVWHRIIDAVNSQLDHERTNPSPAKKLKVSQLTKKKKWWKII